MSDKTFPREMIALATDPKAKLIMFSDYDDRPPGSCENCSGMGFFVVFVASEGPYDSPGNPYRGDGKISHHHNGKWWVGQSYTFDCPVCHGLISK